MSRVLCDSQSTEERNGQQNLGWDHRSIDLRQEEIAWFFKPTYYYTIITATTMGIVWQKCIYGNSFPQPSDIQSRVDGGEHKKLTSLRPTE